MTQNNTPTKSDLTKKQLKLYRKSKILGGAASADGAIATLDGARSWINRVFVLMFIFSVLFIVPALGSISYFGTGPISSFFICFWSVVLIISWRMRISQEDYDAVFNVLEAEADAN